MTRAQANLLGFAAAVVIVVTVTVAGAALAGDALADADRQPAAAHAADRLSAHLVAADATHTREANVLRADRTANLTLDDLDGEVPPARGRAVAVSLGGETVVERGAVGAATGEGVARFQAAAVGSAPRPDGGRRRVPPRARATASPRSHARAYPIARRRRGRTLAPTRSHAAVRPDGPSGAAATLAYSVWPRASSSSATAGATSWRSAMTA